MTIEYLKGDKLIALNPMRRRNRFPALGTVEAYWDGLRDGRLMPTRTDVDPRGIANVLEYAFLLEQIAPGLARIRLAGMHVNRLMAMEVRGMPVSALFLPEARREVQRVIASVLDEPAAVRLALTGARGFARRAREAQMTLLPLRDATGRPSRILGALQASGELDTGPCRFSIRDIETKPLQGDPLTLRAAPPSDHTRDWRPAQSPKAHPADSGANATRTAAHLRLVFDADAT